ncbi:MAG TPA: hypothetical protein QKA14_03105 [Candidatus Megaira endosymbiont of Hartmannula sinica]|nr:hypothetical protein [Candidatus Megaera endosymbiont of Hartmannula sinica]
MKNHSNDTSNHLFLAIEVYLNGVYKVCNHLEENNIKNAKIFPDDVNIILNNIENNILDNIYILFPDPWTKNKYKKKRLVNQARIEKLISKLSTNGTIVFSSDIEDYFNDVKSILLTNKNLKIINKNNYIDYKKIDPTYLKTKYRKKDI